jgi:hypothetical protein
MASTDGIMGVMFALSGIVIVVGLVIHYAWPAKTEQELNAIGPNPDESPRESGTRPNKPRSTLGGVIRLLCIFIGLFVAYALYDAFVVWVVTSR